MPGSKYIIHKLSTALSSSVASTQTTWYNKRMTRKDFNLIASTIDGLISDGTLSPHDAIVVASRFEFELCQTNDRFDHNRFYEAATKSLPRVERQFEEACS